jgi:phosphate-selective porin OprO/OprP
LSHSIDTRFINTGILLNATEELTYGSETAVILGRFHAAGETHWAKVERAGLPDPTFFGGSIEAGFFLTDDTRVYKDGKFSKIKVSHLVNEGGVGAWQVNMRFDRLGLVDPDIIGGVQDAFMASLIWKPVDQMRFLLNYSHIDYKDASGIVTGAPINCGINVISARAQMDF